MAGTLFVVATPIGNQLDWTDRAKIVLAEADLVAAEDTRVLKRELAKVKVKPKKVLSHHEHNEETSTKGLLEALLAGKKVALASDAGTPLISDPGYRLIAAAHENGISVEVVPGASSLTAALSVSPIGGKTFFFGGFLPQQSGERKRVLRRSKGVADKIVFFETPHRLRESLLDALEVMGAETPLVVCRELTKPYEEIKIGKLGDVISHFKVNEPRGEFVLVFKGSPSELLDAGATESEVRRLLNFGRSASDILEELQGLTELTRKQLYDLIVRAKRQV
jgi:16S rRNA (cytidine1402-2'-O)-methyltransferase